MGIASTADSDPQPTPNESSGSNWVFLVAFAVLVSLGILFVYSRFLGLGGQMGVEHLGVGSELSVLSLEPFIDTKEIVNHAALKGNVTLINYWGPWCPPCRLEMPHMAKIEKKYRPHDQFQFLSVVCGINFYDDLNEMRLETENYRDHAKLEFPIYYDPDFTSRAGLESVVGIKPRMMPYPTTVLIDQQGKVAAVWEGFSTDVPRQITEAIDRLITE